jgi:hypothetical protein
MRRFSQMMTKYQVMTPKRWFAPRLVYRVEDALRKQTQGICTPRALTAHLIGSIMSITGTVQPGDKYLHASLPKHHF